MTTIASEKLKSFPPLAVLLKVIKVKEFCWLLLKYSLGGNAMAQWLRFCATNRKVAGSIPAGVIEDFH